MEFKKIKKSDLIKLTAVALVANAFVSSGELQAAPKKGEKSVECFGINGCKALNGCGVGKDQVDLAVKTFPGKFAKAQTIDCAGNIDGSAQSGFLAWIKKESQSECLAAGGFVFEKDQKGNLKIVKKDG